jgi:DNA-binding XRE family transcriptional regulator
MRVVRSVDEADYVALTKEDFESLRAFQENAVAVEAYRRTRSEESIPAEALDRMLAGESPIRVWRRHRGMTQRDLATAIGVGKSHLSEVEAGKGNLSVPRLKAAARVLHVDIALLVGFDES